MEDRQSLNLETRRRYLLRTMMHGLKRIFTKGRDAISLILGVLVWFGICKMWEALSPDYLRGFLGSCQVILTPMVLLVLLYWIGHVKGAWIIYKDLIRIGFVNSVGEAPLLIDRKSTGEGEELVFTAKGLTPSMWQDRQEDLQSAMNVTIGKVTQTHDFRTVRVKVTPPNLVFGQTLYWDPDMINIKDDSDFVLGKTASGEIVYWNCERMPHLLIGGATSSGKTRLAMLVLDQALRRESEVHIIDLKGLDYLALEKRAAQVVTVPEDAVWLLKKTVETMYQRRDLLKSSGVVNFQEYVKKGKSLRRLIILIDECSMLTNSGTAKDAKALSQMCVDYMTTIVRLGRAVGIHMIIATQVPDVASVPTSIRANCDLKICGKADSILSTMVLGDGRADELIPKDARGRFVIANGAEDVVFQAYYYDEGGGCNE